MIRPALRSLLAVGLCLTLVSLARAEEKLETPKVEIVKIEGKTACAHCEYGLDDIGCATSIQAKDGVVFVLRSDGDEFKKFVLLNAGKEFKVEGTKQSVGKAGEVAFVVLKVTKFEVIK